MPRPGGPGAACGVSRDGVPWGTAAPGAWGTAAPGAPGAAAPGAPGAAAPGFAAGLPAAGAAGALWMNCQSEYFCAPSKDASRTRKPAILSGASSDALFTPWMPPSAPLITTHSLPVIGSG